MDDRDRPDTNVVLLRRKGDLSEADRERVASTIFAEPDEIATFSRGNLVPPRPHPRDTDEELAPSSDPFFDRLDARAETDAAQRIDLGDEGKTDAYFDRLAAQSPAEMSASGSPALAVTHMPGSARLPAEIARTSRRDGRLRGRLVPRAFPIRLSTAVRRARFAWPLSTAAVGVVVALAAGIAVIGQSGSSGSEHQSQRDAGANSLELLRPGLLAASANPFGPGALAHRPVTNVRRRHPATHQRPRSRRVRTSTSTLVQTTANHRVVAASYTPVQHSSASVGVTPDTQSSSAAGSTPPPTAPPAPTHYTNSSNSGSGSSSSSASPSKATLRSLVTGAGTCGC